MKGAKSSKKITAIVITFSLIIMGMSVFTGCIEEEEDIDEVVIGMTTEPGDFNPIEQTDVYSNWVFDNIFDPFLSFYPDGEPDTERAILEDWDVSDDGLTYTWVVEEDATFHNGDPVTAEDVKFTFHAHAGDAHEYYDIGEDEIPPSAREGDTENVEEVEVIDEQTVEFHMVEVNSEFINSGLLASMWPLPHEWIEENGYDEYSEDFIGHGPFEFVEYSPGHEIVLEKYEDYHWENAEADRVVFEVFDDESAAVAALRAGRIHYIPSVPSTDYYDLQPEEDVNAVAEPSLGHNQMRFNHRERQELWGDRRVRQAVMYALDCEEIIEAVRGEDLAINTRSPIHPDHPAYDEDADYLYERDLDKAEELLDEAREDGWEMPDRELEFLVTPGEREDEAVVMAEHLEDLGFEVDLISIEFGSLVERRNAGRYDVFILGWTPTASAEYAVTYFRPESPWWYISGWWNTTAAWQFEENITQALRSFGEERREYYANAQQLLIEDAAAFNMYARNDPAAYHDDLEIPEEAWNAFSGTVTNLDVIEFADS